MFSVRQLRNSLLNDPGKKKAFMRFPAKSQTSRELAEKQDLCVCVCV